MTLAIMALLSSLGIAIGIPLLIHGFVKPGWSVLSISTVLFILTLIYAYNSGGSGNSNGYSYEYNNNPEYRENIEDISEIYGISEKAADAKINAVTGGK